MRLWRRAAEERTLTVEPPDAVQRFFGYSTYYDGQLITPASALSMPSVWACVRVLADAAASCPLITYRRTVDDGRRRAGGHTAELLDRPAENVTQAEFVSTVMAHLLLWGNCFIGKYRDAEGRVEQLLPLPPDQVTVERRAGEIRFALDNVDVLDLARNGSRGEHGLDDVIHIKSLTVDGLVGLSPIRQMRSALELDDATRTASTSLFRNNARPSGILSLSSRLNQEQAASLKEQWLGGHAGDRAGGVAVMSGELTWIPVSMPADDAQYIEARKLSATEIARAFRVPPWMVGAEGGDSLTYSNTESQAQSFVTFSLRPWLVQIEQALTADTDLFSQNLYCEFLLDSLLRADSKTRSEVYTAALNPVTGWMRRDEVRRLENLEPETQDAQLRALSTNGREGVIA